MWFALGSFQIPSHSFHKWTVLVRDYGSLSFWSPPITAPQPPHQKHLAYAIKTASFGPSKFDSLFMFCGVTNCISNYWQ